MGQWVYGYLWKDNDNVMHKTFLYADTQDAADTEFEKLSKIKLPDKRVRKARSRA